MWHGFRRAGESATWACLTGSYDLGLNETMSVAVGLAHLQHDQEGALWTAALFSQGFWEAPRPL